jgi:pimeloyl-ACP methyl ester carboxylesterase
MRVQIDDVGIEVETRGHEGPVLVLVHGLGASGRTWSPLSELLAASARVVVPDLRGCGASSRGTAPYTLARAADDIEGVARALGLERYVLVGHSLGGVIVQELLTRHLASVAGAVLISTSRLAGSPGPRLR